jgi:hypothetical protein
MFVVSYTYMEDVEIPTIFQNLYKQYNKVLENISSDCLLLAPLDKDDAKFSLFYVLSKVHKSPISARPITGAYNTITTRAQKGISKQLDEIFKQLKCVTREDGLESSLGICIRIENAIICTQQALVFHGEIDLYSYDFDSMYNNLHVKQCCEFIRLLILEFCHYPPSHIFHVPAIHKTKSDMNPHIWKQLYNMEETYMVELNLDQFIKLLEICFLDFPYTTSKFLHGVILKQIHSIAMGANSFPLFANLALTYVELKILQFFTPSHLSFPDSWMIFLLLLNIEHLTIYHPSHNIFYHLPQIN